MLSVDLCHIHCLTPQNCKLLLMKLLSVFWKVTLLLILWPICAFTTIDPPEKTSFPPATESSCDLPAPHTVTITGATSHSLDVTWTPVQGAATYFVRAINTNSNLPETSFFVSGSVTQVTVPGLQKLTKYRIDVGASACLGVLPTEFTSAFGMTTDIIVDDVIAGVYNQCRPGLVISQHPNPLPVCIEYGQTVGNRYKVYSAIAESPGHWRCSFVVLAPCEEYIVFAMNETGQDSSYNVYFDLTSALLTLWDNNGNQLFSVGNVANGTSLNCLYPGPNKTSFDITFFAQSFYYRVYEEDPQTCYTLYDPPISCAFPQSLTTNPTKTNIIIPTKHKAQTAYQNQLEVLPNPFSQQTTLRYDVPEDSPVTITLLNAMGQTVQEIIRNNQPAGRYEQVLDTSDIPPGVYYLVLQTSEGRKIKPLVRRE